MSIFTFVGSPFVAALGVTLLHFLWQGAVIAAFLAATLAGLEKTNARARYAAASAALVLMALAPPATLLFVLGSPEARSHSFVWPTSMTPEAPPLWPAIVVAAWMAGALFMSARLVVGFSRLSSLVRRGVTPAPAALEARLHKIARRLGMVKKVKLLGSARVDVPMVIGLLRPVVLVPLSAFEELPPRCLDALLAHELAHVRRLDFLTNVLQSIVLAALFYHPAVHWASRVMSRERENICDDDAVAAVGDPVRYARALAELEAMRARLPELALGSNGGSLVMRIRRLIDGKKDHAPTTRALAAPALVLASTLGLALAALAACGEGQTPPAEEPKVTAANAPATLDIPWLPPALRQWEPAITAAAAKNNVDPGAIAIVTLVESNGDPNAKSPGGALGLMQLMPSTALLLAKERGIADHAETRLLDPAYNLDLGASYFGKQLGEFGKQNQSRAVELAAAAYNGGPERVRAWLSGQDKLSDETERYRTLVAGMWNERNAPRSSTYDAWRERVRSKMASRASHPLPGARVTLAFHEETPETRAPHEGVDLAAAAKTAVKAPLDGKVVRVEKNEKGEPILVLAHGAGLETRYRHLAHVTAVPGAKVSRGDVIGEVGEPSGGPHVHFEVLDNGEPIDPARYLGATP